MLSTIHNSSMVSKQRRTRQVAGGVEVVQKPAVIEDYNMYMGGVDKSDQLVIYYFFQTLLEEVVEACLLPSY